MATPNKYQVLIFDLDDTLIDNYGNVRHAYTKMIEAAGEVYSEDNFKRWYKIDKKFWEDRQNNLIEIPARFQQEVGKKSTEFLNWIRAQRFLIYFNHEISLEKAINLNNLFTNALTETAVAIDGARETLEYLAKRYCIIIATNGPQIATKEKLSKIGCLNYVKEVLSADMFGYMKPKKEFYNAIQKLLNNYNNSEYLMIRDSLNSDVKFAMNCGFYSCWFNKNHEQLPEAY